MIKNSSCKAPSTKKEMPLNILTWNINGIRAVRGKTLKQLLDSLASDIICLQETKVTRDMLDEPTAIVDGYDSYFSFSRKRTGYSGTATYCTSQISPVKAEEGLTGRLSTSTKDIVECYGNTDRYEASDLDALDAEGRCVITVHQIRLSCGKVRQVALINVYVPRAGDRQERLLYKLQFLNLLQSRAEALLAKGIHVIILGDLNLTHQQIDNCDCESDGDFKLRSSRIWMNQILQQSEKDTTLPKTDANLLDHALAGLKGGMFSDVYRCLHPSDETAFTNWNSGTNARLSNYGRRLDYILIDTELAQHVLHCRIMREVEGSDHCPVVVTLACEPVSSGCFPQLCSRHMKEFKGQQQKLSNFFLKQVKSQSEPDQSFDRKTPAVLSTQSTASNIVTAARTAKSKSPEKRTKSLLTKPNPKKLKTSQVEDVIKQSSLTTFFSRTVQSNDRVLEKETQTSFSCSQGCLQNSPQEPESTTPGDITSVEVLQPNISSQPEPSLPLNSSSISTEHSIVTQATGPCQIKTSQQDTSHAWRSLLKGPQPPPLCPGHREPCLLKTVNKKGPNKNKQFYICARPEGAPGNPQYRCNFFRWLKS